MSKPGLRKWQRALLGPYLRELADMLNLRDWTINLVHEPIHSQDRAMGMCQAVYGRHWADVSFGAYFLEQSPETQREIIVHELLHCHLPARRDWYGLRELIGHLGAHVFDEAMNREMEEAVDAIANAWAKMLPLPPDLRTKPQKGRKGKR